MLVQVLLGPLVHAVVHQLQLLGHRGLQLFQLDHGLLAVVPAHQHALTVFQIPGAALYPQGHALHLVLGALPAHGVVGVVHLHPIAGSHQPIPDGGSALQNALLVLGDGQHHHLNGGHLGRQHQAVVVAVGHDDAADEPGGHAPGSLEGVGFLVVLVGELNAKGSGKAVAEIVGGTGLQSLPVVHHALDGVGRLRAVELLLLGLLTPGDRHGQHILAEVGVDVQNGSGKVLGLLGSGMDGMSLLPQKFPVAQEGTGGFLPTQDAAPLIVLHRKIPVGLKHMGEVIAEQSLGGGTDGVPLLQLLAAAHGHPGALRGKALHMILLLLQQAFRDQHGHVNILHAHLLKLPIQNMLDVLPDGIAIGTVYENTLDGRIIDKLRLLAHIGEPLGEVHFHICDLFDLFLFCHFIFILSGFL